MVCRNEDTLTALALRLDPDWPLPAKGWVVNTESANAPLAGAHMVGLCRLAVSCRRSNVIGAAEQDCEFPRRAACQRAKKTAAGVIRGGLSSAASKRELAVAPT